MSKDNRRGRNTNRGIDYLNSNWVYYKRLQYSNIYPVLRDMAVPLYEYRMEKLANLDRLAQFFSDAASTELAKE